MFSGIVEGLEKPISIKRDGNGLLVTIPIPKGWQLKVGQSINVDGICSTIQKRDKNTFSIFYMEETLERTHLLRLSQDHCFNLERPLVLNSMLSGHLVLGHIDGVAHVALYNHVGKSVIMRVKIPPKFARYIVYKGSIAVNGVSLTIVSSDKDSFTVSLIPYTLSHTNLGKVKVGDQVNIEVDLVAKYIEKLANFKKF